MDCLTSFPGILGRLLICFAGAVIASGCSQGDPASTSSADHAAPTAALATKTSKVAASDETAGRYDATSTGSGPLVRITTSLGPIDVRLDGDAAPVTVQNFLNYVQSGHYEQTVFHYVEKGQLILGGGFTADGTAKPVGMAVRNEAHNGRKNTRGTVAMARDAAVIDSASSQFFINLEDAPHLDHQGDTADRYGYCVFGDVVRGLEIAEQISAIPTQLQQVDGAEVPVPTRTVQIESVEIVR